MTGRIVVGVVLPDGDEVEVGSLHLTARARQESAVFQYADSYLTDPRAYALGPDLPLSAGPQVPGADRDLFGPMSDSAPDRWGQNLLRRAERDSAREAARTPRTLLPSDFLLGTHDVLRQGALRYRDADGDPLAPDGSGVPRPVDLPRLLELTDRAVTEPGLDADLRDLVDAGGSLGGARPKAAVRHTDGTLRIAKFPRKGSDEWDVMAWEHLTLDLAADAGIDVPRHELVRIAGRSVLLLDRFDRTAGGRLGYISAMTLVGATERTSDLSMAELAEEAAAVSASPRLDMAALLRRALFSVLVSNTDNHLRNHGFLRTARGWTLSPAFDLNPDPESGRSAMPLTPDGDGLSAALAWSDVFGVSRVDAVATLAEVSAAVDGWRRRAELAGIARGEIALMSAAFESPARAEASALV